MHFYSGGNKLNSRKRYHIYISVMYIFLIILIVFSASIGSSSIGVFDSLELILSKIPFLNRIIDISDINQVYEVIVWKVRLPRILQSSLVGGALAVVGCTFQAIFRNSIADPHILGVSSGAALGATLAILSGITLNFMGISIVSIFAFIGAVITIILVYKFGRIGGNIIVTNLLLTGTAISTMLSSAISLLMIYNREQLEKVYLWTLGSFSSSNWSKVLFLFFVSVISLTVIFMFSRELNIILTGDEVASSLGIDTGKVKNILIIISAFLVAGSVCVSGTIGFVGLIIPHCMRLLVGSDHRILLPFSYLGGSFFMILCDTIARIAAKPTEIPVGVITAFFGAPYFIYLLYRNTKNRSF